MRYWKGKFPGGLVLKTTHFHRCSPGSIAGLGTEITHQADTCHGQKREYFKKKKDTGETDWKWLRTGQKGRMFCIPVIPKVGEIEV